MRAWVPVMAAWMMVPGLAGARWEPGPDGDVAGTPGAAGPSLLTLQASPWVLRGDRLALSLAGTTPSGSAHLLASHTAGVALAPSAAFGGPMPDLAAPMRHVASSPFAGSAQWSMVVDGYAQGGQVAFQVVHAAGRERVISNSVVVRLLEREADDDGDGVANAVEVAQGLDPLGPGALAAPAPVELNVAPAGPPVQAPVNVPDRRPARKSSAVRVRGADSADSGGGRR